MLATFLVACFGYIFATAPAAHAADVTWSGDSIVYEERTYVSVESSDTFPADIKASPAIYQHVDDTRTPNLIYFIYFNTGVTEPKSEKEATYIRYTLNPPNRYVNPTGKKTVSLEAVNPEEPNEGDGLLTGNCTISGIGYVICPAMNGIAEGMDFVYKSIRGFLEVQPMTTDVNNPIYRIWIVMRDIANIAFVMGFLVIIYSYLVGGGFNGYEIRKILPRIVLAATLINLSYLICAVAVDISNIAGYSINQLFETVRDSTLSGSDTGVSDVNWTSVTAWVLAAGGGAAAANALLPGITGGTTVAAAASGLWMLLVPFLFGGALIVMVTFLILAARQALIFILIAIAPLAFAAYILPNTEKWFEKWRSLFFTMLIMFPAFGAVFGASQLAGDAIIRMAKQTGSIEQIILGLGVMLAPLAITPLLLRLGGGVLNRFAGVINNPQKGLHDRVKNYSKERMDERRANANKLNAEALAAGGLTGRRQFARRRAANNFAKKNYRKTRKERDEEAAQNAWHNQTGQWGYSNNNPRSGDPLDNRDPLRNRFTRQPREGYGNLDTYKRDNQLQHNLTEAEHEEHWQHTLDRGGARRDILTDTRMAENRSKVMSGAMEAKDERTFQTALNNDSSYAALKNMKIQTTVDAGVADVQKAAIESLGKLSLSTEVSNDRDLRKMKVTTFENEKRAETMDNILKKNAEANWNNLSKNDAATQELRLREIQASDQAKITDDRFNTMVENIVASGSAAPSVVANAAVVADSIKDIRQDIQIEAKAQDAAKVQQNTNLMAALKASQEAMIDPSTGGDATLLKRAAGIGGVSAEARIFAQATKTVVDAAVQEVKDDRYLLSQYTRAQLHNVLFQGQGLHGETVTTEMQQAAMYELLQKKGNNQDAQTIRNAIRDMGMVVDETTGKFYEPEMENGRVKIVNGRPVADVNRPIDDKEVGNRRDWQQFFIDAAGGSPHSQVTLSGTDKSDGESGTMLSGVSDGFMRDARGGKFGPEKMLKADIDELKFLYTDIVDPNGEYARLGGAEKTAVDKTIVESIIALQKHPTYKGQIDDRNRGVMNQIVAKLDPSYDTGTTDANGKPVYYVNADKTLMQKPSNPTGSERTFSAPVDGTMDTRQQNGSQQLPEWKITRK